MVFVVMSIQHVAYWNCPSESQMSEGGGQGGAKNHPNDLKLTWRCSQFLFEKTETFTMKTLMIGSMSNSHHKPWLNVSGSHTSYFNSYIEISHSRIGWPHLVKKRNNVFYLNSFSSCRFQWWQFLKIKSYVPGQNVIGCHWMHFSASWMRFSALFFVVHAQCFLCCQPSFELCAMVLAICQVLGRLLLCHLPSGATKI